MIPAKRGRGRPRKDYTPPSEFEELKNEFNEAMERCCYKSNNETISEMREYRIRSRRESDLPSSIASEEFD